MQDVAINNTITTSINLVPLFLTMLNTRSFAYLFILFYPLGKCQDNEEDR